MEQLRSFLLLGIAGVCCGDNTEMNVPMETLELRSGAEAIDVLLIVKRGACGIDDQIGLAENVLPFIESFGDVDLRVGVTTGHMGLNDVSVEGCGTGRGDEAAALPLPGDCDGDGETPLIVNVPSGSEPERLRDVKCLIENIGRFGCAIDRPIEALVEGTDPLGVNSSWLRPDADLVAVIISDEDDCSASNESFYADSASIGGDWCLAEATACEEGDFQSTGVKQLCRAAENSPNFDSMEVLAKKIAGHKSPGKNFALVTIAGTYNGDPTSLEVGRSQSGAFKVLGGCRRLESDRAESEPAPRLASLVDAWGYSARFNSLCLPLEETLPTVGVFVEQLRQWCLPAVEHDWSTCSAVLKRPDGDSSSVSWCVDETENGCLSTQTEPGSCDYVNGHGRRVVYRGSIPTGASVELSCRNAPPLNRPGPIWVSSSSAEDVQNVTMGGSVCPDNDVR